MPAETSDERIMGDTTDEILADEVLTDLIRRLADRGFYVFGLVMPQSARDETSSETT